MASSYSLDTLLALPLHIERAFNKLIYPGDGEIVHGDDWESLNIAATFRGLDWRDIPYEVLEYEQAALTFFTPVAFRFYLPAFLIASVGDPPDFESFVRDKTLRRLDPTAYLYYRDGSLRAPQLEIFRERDERDAILHFLKTISYVDKSALTVLESLEIFWYMTFE